MSYTLSSKGVALGHTAFELPTAAPETLTGFFHPTEALATAGAPLLAMSAEFASWPTALRDVVPSEAELADVPPAERGLRIQAALRADPGTQRRVNLQKAAEGLLLELHDEQGSLLPTKAVYLMPFLLPAILPANVTAEELRGLIREDSAEAGVAVSDLLIVVIRASSAAGAA